MNYDIVDEKAPDNDVAAITKESLEYLKETAKWAKFLSILGFIGLGFLLFMGIMFFFIGDLLSEYNPYGGLPLNGIAVMYLLMVVIGFFPVNYQFLFARKTLKAIAMNDNIAMELAFRNLKSYYKFTGILTIISLLPLVVVLLAAISGSALLSAIQ